MSNLPPALLSIACACLLGACVMGPAYQPPKMELPENFKVKGPWKVAEPSAHEPKGEWWTVFADAELSRLETKAMAENPGLQAALQRVEKARAVAGEARSALFPELTIGVEGTRVRGSASSSGFRAGQTRSSVGLPVDFSYELDLWGGVRKGLEATKADVQQAEALAENAKLRLQAELAINYLRLRSLDAERAVLDEAVAVREKTLNLVKTRFQAGDVAELDVAQAETELAGARAEAIALEKERSQLENAVAILCGQMPSLLRLARKPLNGEPPRIQRTLPSELLERRPDVAAAERAMAAANARIGVAQAAFFPRLSLGIGTGLESAALDTLVNGGSHIWSLAGQFSEKVIDGGARSARKRQAIASYEETAASYKETVLGAFRDVEDALSALDVLKRQAQAQNETVTAARRTVELAEKRYTSGLVSYFEVVDAQRALLRAEQGSIRVQGGRFEAAALLIKAVGGRW